MQPDFIITFKAASDQLRLLIGQQPASPEASNIKGEMLL